MTDAATEIETIETQIADLRELWSEAASAGRHSEAVGIENEIAALERSAARYKVQADAQAVERKRQRAIASAEATLAQVESHKVARAELEGVLTELEQAADTVAAAMGRLRPVWTAALATYPAWQQYPDPMLQEAYNDALGSEKYASFEQLRLAPRLQRVLDILIDHGGRGAQDIMTMSHGRF